MTAISGNSIVTEIEKFIGDPYVYGAAGPSSFDCSGLVQFALTKLGVSNVPRTSEEQYAWATKINASQLEPGDLVFAQFAADTGSASPGHVGVYVGNGRVLSAEDPAQGIGYDTLSDWGSAIVGYGRVPDSSAGTGATLDSSSGILGDIGALGNIASAIGGVAKDFSDVATAATWLVNPGHWFRIGAFFVGAILLIGAIYLMTKDHLPSAVPVPIPVLWKGQANSPLLCWSYGWRQLRYSLPFTRGALGQYRTQWTLSNG